MITNKNLLLIPATELTKLRLTCSKCFIRCADMVDKRRRESDVSIIHTRTSNLMHFKLFFVVWSINRSVHISGATAKMIVLNENKIKVNPDQRARPNYNWRKHITV